ncbi:MAG: SAM-dependent methyltransferase, partial [Gemmatimonadetes bacterium]|nr:SAM-dependent methyltransferase [Gemmatimonadota bacterium]
SPDHLPCLESKLDTVLLREARAPLPWLPGLRAPYYVWIGRRRGAG